MIRIIHFNWEKPMKQRTLKDWNKKGRWKKQQHSG